MLNAGNHIASLLSGQKLCKSGQRYTGGVEDAEAMNVGVTGGQDPSK